MTWSTNCQDLASSAAIKKYSIQDITSVAQSRSIGGLCARLAVRHLSCPTT